MHAAGMEPRLPPLVTAELFLAQIVVVVVNAALAPSIPPFKPIPGPLATGHPPRQRPIAGPIWIFLLHTFDPLWIIGFHSTPTAECWQADPLAYIIRVVGLTINPFSRPWGTVAGAGLGFAAGARSFIW